MTRRIAGWALCACLVLGLAYWFLFTQEEGGSQVSLENVAVDVALEQIELIQGEGGKISWRLRARRATYNKDESVANLEDPTFTFFMQEGNRTVTVSASYGEVHQKRDWARLWPDIRADYDDYRFTADEVVYNGQEQRVAFTGNVHMIRPGMDFSCQKALLELDTQQLNAEGGVTMKLSGESFSG